MTNWPCPMWAPCSAQDAPSIVTAAGDALVVAVVVLVVGGVLVLVGLGRAE